MIGKPEWFTYRIFGWGIGPRTWQGWVYLAAVAAIMGLIKLLLITNTIRVWSFGILVGLVVLDVIHIMTRLDKEHDERERLQQLIIERNCSFAAVAAMAAIMLFQTFQNRSLAKNGTSVDVSILIVLGAMAVTKIISTWHVRRKI